jgi:hypothetical protein
MTIFKHKELNTCNHNFVLYSPWMMSLLSETVPSAFRVPLELITVALLVLVLSVTTWSPPCTFFNIPGRHDSSVSPDKINTNICNNSCNFTDNCCTTNFNKWELILSKLRIFIMSPKCTLTPKELRYIFSKIITPFTSTFFQHLHAFKPDSLANKCFKFYYSCYSLNSVLSFPLTSLNRCSSVIQIPYNTNVFNT